MVFKYGGRRERLHERRAELLDWAGLRARGPSIKETMHFNLI